MKKNMQLKQNSIFQKIYHKCYIIPPPFHPHTPKHREDESAPSMIHLLRLHLHSWEGYAFDGRFPLKTLELRWMGKCSKDFLGSSSPVAQTSSDFLDDTGVIFNSRGECYTKNTGIITWESRLQFSEHLRSTFSNLQMNWYISDSYLGS